MSKRTWGTTFKPGEFEKLQKELWPHKPVKSIEDMAPAKGIFRSHDCTVMFPDGKPGKCRYERKGPTLHVFTFHYDADAVELCHVDTNQPLANDRLHVEHKAQEQAAVAYDRAIYKERRDYFQRASPEKENPNGRRAHPERFQTKTITAKEWSGKYALCSTGGQQLRLFGGVVMYDKIETANYLWEHNQFTDAFGKKGKAWELKLVVGCFNRLDRCWELPRFNPTYREHDLRDEYTQYLPEKYHTMYGKQP